MKELLSDRQCKRLAKRLAYKLPYSYREVLSMVTRLRRHQYREPIIVGGAVYAGNRSKSLYCGVEVMMAMFALAEHYPAGRLVNAIYRRVPRPVKG